MRELAYFLNALDRLTHWMLTVRYSREFTDPFPLNPAMGVIMTFNANCQVFSRDNRANGRFEREKYSMSMQKAWMSTIL